LHVVWHDFRDGNYELYYKEFDGANWGDDLRLTGAYGNSQNPSILVDCRGTVHVFWHDVRTGSFRIYHKLYDGTSWSVGQALSSAADCAVFPAAAVDSAGAVHVVWHDYRDGDAEIYHKVYDGVGWGPDERLTIASRGSLCPSIAADYDGGIHVVWHDYRDGDAEIYYKYYDGFAWGADERLTTASGNSRNPSVTVGYDGVVHVVWYDGRDGDWEIYHTQYDGISWSVDERLTYAAGESKNPSVVVDPNGCLHVVWYDDRDGNSEIYWKRTAPGPMSKPDLISVQPDTGFYSENLCGISVTGEHFFWPSWVWLQKAGEPDLVPYRVSMVCSTEIVLDAWIECTLGMWDVVVKNLDGQADTLPSAFAVMLAPKPHILAISPDSGVHTEPLHIDNLAGTGLLNPASVWLQKAGQPPLIAYNVNVRGRTSITCDLDLDKAADGLWDVVVENPDGQKDTLAYAFRVFGIPTPLVFSIDPDSGMYGAVVHIADLAGANFIEPASVRLVRDGESDVVASNVVVETLEHITCDINLNEVARGYWDVAVTNAGGPVGALDSGFYVIPLPDPSIESIVPSAGPTGEAVSIPGLTGSNFVSPASIWFRKAGACSLAATGVAVQSPELISCEIDLGAAFPGLWDVVVRNPDGGMDTLAEAFEVTPGIWTYECRLTDDDAASNISRPNGASVATDAAGTVHVVWHDDRTGQWQRIFYKKHDGSGWSEDIQIAGGTGHARNPAIAVGPDNTIHVVWVDYRDDQVGEIYYMKSVDGEWGVEERLTESSGYVQGPSIAVDGSGDIHIVFYDSRSSEWQIYYLENDGSGWQPEVALTAADGDRGLPCVATDSQGNVHVVWYDCRNHNSDIYYRRHNGSEWEPEVDLVDWIGKSWGGYITVGPDDRLHLVWHDDVSGDFEIYYMHHDGYTWSVEKRLTNASGVSANAVAAVDGDGRINVVWRDDRDGNREIYHKRFTGSEWGPDHRLTAAPGNSIFPSVAIEPDGRVHLVWEDSRHNNSEIYYKLMHPNGCPAGVEVEVHRDRFGITDVVPNPGWHSSEVRFGLVTKSPAEVSVFDVTGRLVWRLDMGKCDPGTHSVRWNGTDSRGNEVSCGVYFVQLRAGTKTSSAKIVILR
jgi:hypothetical protein